MPMIHRMRTMPIPFVPPLDIPGVAPHLLAVDAAVKMESPCRPLKPLTTNLAFTAFSPLIIFHLSTQRGSIMFSAVFQSESFQAPCPRQDFNAFNIAAWTAARCALISALVEIVISVSMACRT